MLKWVDTLDIAIELSEKYPDEDPSMDKFCRSEKSCSESRRIQ